MSEFYKTRQRELLLACLRENERRHINVDMIMEYLRANGAAVGRATVYRNLDKLVAENVVLKYDLPNGAGACYQYINCGHEDHYHMLCTVCGRLCHLSCQHVKQLSEHIQQEHRFDLDIKRTVFYGRCENC